MTYDTCLKLKQAGFPQDLIVYPTKDRVWGPEDSIDGSFEHCYIPTLAELIAECGDRFGHLCRWEKGNDIGDWQAISRTGSIIEWGATPESAIANLYLALRR